MGKVQKNTKLGLKNKKKHMCVKLAKMVPLKHPNHFQLQRQRLAVSWGRTSERFAFWFCNRQLFLAILVGCREILLEAFQIVFLKCRLVLFYGFGVFFAVLGFWCAFYICYIFSLIILQKLFWNRCESIFDGRKCFWIKMKRQNIGRVWWSSSFVIGMF